MLDHVRSIYIYIYTYIYISMNDVLDMLDALYDNNDEYDDCMTFILIG